LIRGALVFMLIAITASSAQQKQDIPDAPIPQASGAFSDIKDQIAPGKGATDQSSTPQNPAPTQSAPPQKDDFQQPTPDMPSNTERPGYILHVPVNFVEVPVTVKDQKGHLISGLEYRDFRIFENNQRQPIQFFSVDPTALSVVFVIDQTVPHDVMQSVNESLSAISGAMASYDEAAVVTYNNGPSVVTGFTGAQSARLNAALISSQRPGRDNGTPVNSGPLASGPTINGHIADPNLAPQRGNASGFLLVPKEIHTLNDAIFAAAKLLADRPKDRFRVIYVIGEGKEQGSKISQKEVIRFLQTHEISVYATMVGDAAIWGEGYLERRIHVPLQASNVLPKYILATGGDWNAEVSANGIERSYAHIAEEARNRYTLGYYSHEPTIDGKYRNLDVRVLRPDVDVIAKPGYYPSAQAAQ
jgi:VWFA-related protein